MKKTHLRVILATVIYGAFIAVFLVWRHGFPGGIVPAAVASVIYLSLVSVLLRKQVI